jgi:hypothetical protein
VAEVRLNLDYPLCRNGSQLGVVLSVDPGHRQDQG